MSIYKTSAVIFTGEDGGLYVDIASIIDNVQEYAQYTQKHGVFNTLKSINTSAIIVYESSTGSFRVYCLIYQQDIHVEDIVYGFKTFSKVIKSTPIVGLFILS